MIGGGGWRAARVALALAAGVTGISVASGAVQSAPAAATSNGLALTPYMGWNTYFGLGTRFSETSILDEASTMASDGLLAAGYRYIWLDGGGPSSWPNGISSMVSQLHSMGFEVGTYTTVDETDANGKPCVDDTLATGVDQCAATYQQTVDQYATDGFDAVKVDVVGNAPVAENAHGWPSQWPLSHFYKDFAAAIQNDSPHRPILLNVCDYLTPGGTDAVPYAESSYDSWSWAPAVANSWRTDTDIGYTRRIQWSDVMRNLDADSAHPQAAGPGAWNDPDYLTPQMGSLTASESQAELTMWSMLAAPLMIGSDVESLSSQTVGMLTNPSVIAIDQDSLGVQAVAYSTGQGQTWVRPLADGDWAVALLNRGGTADTIDTALAGLGLPAQSSYSVTDVWAGTTSTSGGSLSYSVPAHSAVLLRVTPTGTALPTNCSITSVPISNSHLCQYGVTGPYTYSNGVEQYWFVAGNHSVWTIWGSGSSWSQSALGTSSVTSGVSLDASTGTSASSDGVSVCAQGSDASTQGRTEIADVWCDNKGDGADAGWTNWYQTGPPGPPVGASGVNSCSIWSGSYTCEYGITGPHVYPDGTTETWAVAGVPPNTSVWTHTSSGWAAQPGGAGNGFGSSITLSGTGWGITLCGWIGDGKWCDTRGNTSTSGWAGWEPVNCTWDGETYPCGDGVTGPYVFPSTTSDGNTQQEYWTIGTDDAVWTYWNNASDNWYWNDLGTPNQSNLKSLGSVSVKSTCESGTGWAIDISVTASLTSGGPVTWYDTRTGGQTGSWGGWTTSVPPYWNNANSSC